MPTLEGRRIALLESRRSDDLAAMVRRLGGSVISAPAVRELPLRGECDAVIDRVIAGEFAVAVVLTGSGISALIEAATSRGSGDRLVAALGRMTLACRGPKPLGVLKRYGLSAAITTAKPHTTNELLGALESLDLRGRTTVLLHYGERNDHVADALRQRGAILEELCLYEWALPTDTAPIQTVIEEAIAGRVDAILFTSQIQFRHLSQLARDMGTEDALISALNRHVVVGAVGPVCAGALREGGVYPDVLPASPSSISLVSAVAEYFDLTNDSLEQP